MGKRTVKELRAVYARFTATGVFAYILVGSLSQFKSFLADLLVVFMDHYPQRITDWFKASRIARS